MPCSGRQCCVSVDQSAVVPAPVRRHHAAPGRSRCRSNYSIDDTLRRWSAVHWLRLRRLPDLTPCSRCSEQILAGIRHRTPVSDPGLRVHPQITAYLTPYLSSEKAGQIFEECPSEYAKRETHANSMNSPPLPSTKLLLQHCKQVPIKSTNLPSTIYRSLTFESVYGIGQHPSNFIRLHNPSIVFIIFACPSV